MKSHNQKWAEYQKQNDQRTFWITVHEEEEILMDLVNVELTVEQAY